MRRSILVVIICVIIVLSGVLIVVYGFNVFSADYNLELDPLKDEQNLFSTARVALSNTGKLPLTNVVINYGGQITESVDSISPGQKLLLSPPGNVPLDFVTVTTGEGLNLTKVYRTPIKLPGMMGS
ncbi:MAG TPA: hypothetical protein VFG77_00720 [Nitrososphaeraceae archaeon]|jgi:hypothetical protein|nr:hypothetical protein [Nitrososphaeraceae archaeon]